MEPDAISHLLADLNTFTSAVVAVCTKVAIDSYQYLKISHRRYRVLTELIVLCFHIIDKSERGIATSEALLLVKDIIQKSLFYSVLPVFLKQKCLLYLYKRTLEEGKLNFDKTSSKHEAFVKSLIKSQGLTEAGSHSLIYLVRTVYLLSI